MERRDFFWPRRDIPEDAIEFREVERRALLALYQEHYSESVELFKQSYRILYELQFRIERGIHKGSVLYNLGIAILGEHNRQSTRIALKNILLAYIEDTLGTDFDFEDDADRAPAGRFLIDGYFIQLRFLREIKSYSRILKENRENWFRANDPEEILDVILSRFNITKRRMLDLCLRRDVALGPAPLGFPQPPEKRVFIGLNYDQDGPLIPEIRSPIIQKQLTPILVRDTIIPNQGNVHDVSLLLLHTCGWAIFDVTHPAGQFMEIERARDYGVKVLILRAAPIGHQANISAMITALGYQTQTYRDMPHLRQLVLAFLP